VTTLENARKKEKGKVQQSVSLKTTTKAQTKKVRRAQKRALLQKKRQEVILRKRLTTNIDHSPPKIVGIISLGEGTDQRALINLFASASQFEGSIQNSPLLFLPIPHEKQNLLIYETPRKLDCVLEIAKVADILLMLLPAMTGIDNLGEQFISVVKAQGLPATIGAIQGLESIPSKNQHELKKII